MQRHRRSRSLLVASLVFAAAIGAPTSARTGQYNSVNGTIWVANRGTSEIKAFDADTGEVVRTVPMAANSQGGDLGYAKGKLYVTEELGAAPGVAIVDAVDAVKPIRRIPTGAGSRPHHVHVSSGGDFVAVSLFGTDKVAIVDTHDDTVKVWDSNPNTTDGRIHAAEFSTDASTLYLASDATGKVIAMDRRTGAVHWALDVAAAHELAVTHDQRLLYVSRRTANKLAVIQLDKDVTNKPTGFTDVLTLGLPDTLRLSANEDLLTVGLRTTPAQVALVDTRTFASPVLVELSPGQASSLAGHQWTSPDGRYTLAAFEGGATPGVAIIDHKLGNEVVTTLSYPGRPHGIIHTHP